MTNLKNCFTNIIVQITFPALKFMLMVLFILSSIIYNKASAQVVLNNPSVTVASCGYPTAYYTIPAITITEALVTDIGPQTAAGNTLDLYVTAPFQFKTAVGTVAVTGGNVTAATLSYINVTTLRITYTTTSAPGGALDKITISNLQVQATAATVAGTSYYMANLNDGSSVINGGVGPAYATFYSSVYPGANAGNDQLKCATSTTMGADLPAGSTGTWSYISGPGPVPTITGPTTTTAGISGMTTDGTYTFRWTITNGSCSSFSNVTITVQTTAGSMACLTPVNQFSAVSSITAGGSLTCPPSGTTTFTLANAGPFNVGDKVLVIQMQGATANVADSSVLTGTTSGKDAVFGSITSYNGAGNYEYAIIATKSGSDVTFAGGLKNFYSAGAGKNVQLVTVPQIPAYTVASGNTLLGTPWDRTTGTGGVLIFEVIGTLTINGTISMDYRGFLGGGNVAQTSLTSTTVVKPGSYPNFGVFDTGNCKGDAECGMGPYSTACMNGPCGGNFLNNIPFTDGTLGSYGAVNPFSNIAGGYKGDGIASNYLKWPYGHGAVANGGGSGAGWNGGGGGGSNVCAGGYGGDEYTACYSNLTVDGSPYYKLGTRPLYDLGGTCGSNFYHIKNATTQARMRGIGGYALSPAGPTVFMGGGGGGGNGDGNAAAPGGNGGGIIMITAATIAGTTGTITAKGQIGYTDCTGEANVFVASNVDGTGGGGAGGSVILNVGSYSIGTLNVNVRGGDGGDEKQAASCFGSGGGGGGGLVRYNAITSNVQITAAGGVWGAHNPGGSSACAGTAYGSTSGSSCAGSKEALVSPIPQKACCTAADLGPDQSICGQASITLLNGTASNTNKNFYWYKNGVLQPGSPCTACPTFSATSSGVYTVKVDSIGGGTVVGGVITGGIIYCSSSSSMTINNTFPTPYLGPNQVLCSPSYLNLAPINQTFPTGTVFSWAKNGVTISGATSSTLTNATTGTYTLTATAGAGCGPSSGSITLTSGSPTVTGSCRSTAGTLTLSATGGNGGPYTWWTASTGGTQVGTGTSYTTPSISSTTTYYVQDVATTNVVWGIDTSAVINRSGGSQLGSTSGALQEVFNVLVDTIILNAVTVHAAAASTNGTIQVTVRNSADAQVGTPGTITVTTVADHFYTVVFTTPVKIPPGTGYYLDATGTTPQLNYHAFTNLTGYSGYPIYGSDVALGNMIQFTNTNNSTAGSQTTTWGTFFDWKMSYIKYCDRVPVVAEIGGSCAALPISLSSFTAEKSDKDALLAWSTNAEQNNEYFLVQRSNDGGSFETIGKVEGNGTSYILHNYNFVDVNIPAAVLYYRLMQVDKDGKSSITRVVSVNNMKETSINVYPNPFENGINVVLKSGYDYKVNLKISDLRGVVQYAAEGIDNNGTIVVGQNLPDGVYVLEVRSDEGVQTFRIVKLGK
jgi:hypothetical protein